MTEQEKFYKVYPQYSGVLEMHEAGSIDWLNAMIPVRMFAVWQSAKESAKEECANLCELSYCKDKEQHLLLARVAQHIREIK